MFVLPLLTSEHESERFSLLLSFLVAFGTIFEGGARKVRIFRFCRQTLRCWWKLASWLQKSRVVAGTQRQQLPQLICSLMCYDPSLFFSSFPSNIGKMMSRDNCLIMCWACVGSLWARTCTEKKSRISCEACCPVTMWWVCLCRSMYIFVDQIDRQTTCLNSNTTTSLINLIHVCMWIYYVSSGDFYVKIPEYLLWPMSNATLTTFCPDGALTDWIASSTLRSTKIPTAVKLHPALHFWPLTSH